MATVAATGRTAARETGHHMRATPLATFALLAVTTAAPDPAHAAPTSAAGLTCGMTATTDPTAEPGTRTGEIRGGPVSAHDPHGPVRIWIVCTVQVNSRFHDGSSVASASSAIGDRSAYLPPTQISYAVQSGDAVYLCTEWHLVDPHGTHHRLLYDATPQQANPLPEECALATDVEGSNVVEQEPTSWGLAT